MSNSGIFKSKNMKALVVVFITVIALFLIAGRAIAELAVKKSAGSARGIIKAEKRAVISSEIEGSIIKVPFKQGDRFKKGDILVAFDCSLLDAHYQKIKAEFEAAVRQYENSQELAKLKSVSILENDLARIEVERKGAELKIAEITVSRCKIHAPFSGAVVTLEAREHESVNARQKLIEILSSENLEIEVLIPVEWISRITTGRMIIIYADKTRARAKAEIITTGADVDPASQMLILRGRIVESSGNLLPGMTVTVEFDKGSAAKKQ